MNTVSILGSHISVLDSYRTAYRYVMEYVRSNEKPAYITVNNVHTVIEGVLHADYRAITNQAFLALPDGKPLSIVARWKGITNISRVFGPTFFEKALEWGQEDVVRHFFFGSSPQVLDTLQSVIRDRFPRAQIAGAIAPPFRPLTASENAMYIEQMNRSKADIVWVALGAPKQERWMAANYRYLNRGVMIGIGAGFDYLAGNTQHAPEWMKRYALEWLYRLIQEPHRLWKRYLVTNTLFVILVVLELLGIQRWEGE